MIDADVRSAMLQRLQLEHAGDCDTRIIEEMGVWSGHVRIDIAVINGELCGFELKSDRDTLSRLPNQAAIYSRVFDRVELVVGNRHHEKAVELIPPWWGVTTATMRDGHIALEAVKVPDLNPAPDPYLLAQLLWKDEAISVLQIFGLDAGWRSKRVMDIHRRLAELLKLDDLRFYVRAALKSRGALSREVGSDLLNMPVY